MNYTARSTDVRLNDLPSSVLASLSGFRAGKFCAKLVWSNWKPFEMECIYVL